MPKKPVTDPITEREMIFVHLLSSGTMTDREAAQAAGLNPETASYTKAKPEICGQEICGQTGLELCSKRCQPVPN